MEATPRRRQRVPALSAEQRRAALIEATIPLLREHGAGVTTRQIADAAGVAEGTIFGVFPDKISLIRAAVLAALNTAPLLAQLREIAPAADLRTRLIAMAELLHYRIVDNGPLVTIVRTTAGLGGNAWPPAEWLLARQEMLTAIAAVIEPDRHLLRHSPEMTARLFQSMVMAGGRGVFGEPDILDARELVSLLLDGLLVQAPASGGAGPGATEAKTIQESPRADSTAA